MKIFEMKCNKNDSFISRKWEEYQNGSYKMNMIDIIEMNSGKIDSVSTSKLNKSENENDWLKVNKVLE